MKKIMIAFAIALCAVAGNAATVSWNSGSFRSAANANGGWTNPAVSKSFADGTSLVASLFLVDAATFTAASEMSSSALYATYIGQDATVTVKSSGNNVAVKTTADVGQDYYAVVIYTYIDATYGEMYIAATAKIDGSSIDNAANTYNVSAIGSTAGAASGWSAVPEPTSAMLLVLGVAALALRRKQK